MSTTADRRNVLLISNRAEGHTGPLRARLSALQHEGWQLEHVSPSGAAAAIARGRHHLAVLDCSSANGRGTELLAAARGAGVPVMGLLQAGDPAEHRPPDEAARQALSAAEERFRAMADALPETVFELDAAGRLTFVNRTGFGWWNFDPADLAGFDVAQAVVPEQRDRLRSRVARVMGGEELRSEYLALRKDGTAFPVVIHSKPVIASGRVSGVRGVIVDVSEQRRAQEALRLTQFAVDQAGAGIHFVDSSGRVLYANEAACSSLGYAADEMGSLHVGDFDVTLSKQRFPEVWAELKRRGRVTFESRHRHKSGSEFPVEVTVNHIDVGGEERAVAFIWDVSERRALEGQLRQAQKMEAVGRLAGGVAHDFNNILTAILGNADLLDEDLGELDPRREHVEQIRKAAERAAALTRQLLAFSRKRVSRPDVVDLNALVAGLEKMLRRVIGEDVQMVTASSPGLGAVRVDPGQVEQVVMNLVVNARDAMPGGGTVTMETANVEIDENAARLQPGLAAGSYVTLTIADTGCGMTPEVQAHLFEPFFTTKEPGKGTGLGLATVYGIVRQNGGYVSVQSEAGRGTSVKVCLPRCDAPAAGSPGAGRAPAWGSVPDGPGL